MKTADGCRNIGWRQTSHRHLVQPSLEKVVVLPVNQRDADVVSVAEFLGGIQPSETTTPRC